LVAPSLEAGLQVMESAGMSRRDTMLLYRAEHLRGLSGIILHHVGGTLPLPLSDELAWVERNGRVQVVDELPAHSSPTRTCRPTCTSQCRRSSTGFSTSADWSSWRVGLGSGVCRGTGSNDAQKIISATRQALTLTPLATDAQRHDRSASGAASEARR